MLERNPSFDPSCAGDGIVFADEVRRMVEASPAHDLASRKANIEPALVGAGIAHGRLPPSQPHTMAREGCHTSGQSGALGDQARIPPRYRHQQSRGSAGWCPWARARCGDLAVLVSSCLACGSSAADAAGNSDKTTHRPASCGRRPSERSVSRAGGVPCRQHGRATFESAMSSTVATSNAAGFADVDISAISEIKEADARFGMSTPYLDEQGGTELLERLQRELASKMCKVNDEPFVDPGLPPLKPPKVPEEDFRIGTTEEYFDDSVSHSEPEKTTAALARTVCDPAADKDQRLASEVLQRCRAFCTLDALEALDERRQRDLMLLLPGCKAIRVADSGQGPFAHAALTLSEELSSKRKVPSEAASWERSTAATSSAPTCDSSTSSNCSSDSEVNAEEPQSYRRPPGQLQFLSSARVTDSSSGSDSARLQRSARRLPDAAASTNKQTPVLDDRNNSKCAHIFRSPIDNLKNDFLLAHERQSSASAATAGHSPRMRQSSLAPKSSTPDCVTLSEDVVASELVQELRPLGRRSRLKTAKPSSRRSSAPLVRPAQVVSASGSSPSRRVRPPATKYGVSCSRLPDPPQFAVQLSASEDSCSFGYGSSDSGVQPAAGRSPSLPPHASSKAPGSDAHARARSSEGRHQQPKSRGCSQRAPSRKAVAPLAPWEEPPPTRNAGKRTGTKPRSRRPQRRSCDSSSRDPRLGTPRESRFP